MKLTKSKAEASNFRLHASNDGNGWQWLQISDGYWLSMGYGGNAYRSDFDNKVAWKIIGGELYTNYDRFKDEPVEAHYLDVFVTAAYYVGVEWGDQDVLTHCELVPAQ